MISLDPANRPSFEALLHNARGTIFPECFYSFLHSYVTSINELPTSSPFSGPPSTAPSVPLTPTTANTGNATMKPSGSATPISGPSAGALNGTGGPLPSDADHRIERIWSDYESIEPYVAQEAEDEDAKSMREDYPHSTESYQVLPILYQRGYS